MFKPLQDIEPNEEIREIIHVEEEEEEDHVTHEELNKLIIDSTTSSRLILSSEGIKINFVFVTSCVTFSNWRLYIKDP